MNVLCTCKGLDPASRRGLWDVVKGNKAGKALILTTHSMEEAEMLCDRLGIFVDGQLVCIGNPKEITGRYAGYLVFTITVHKHEEPKARKLVEAMSRSAALTYALGGTLKVGQLVQGGTTVDYITLSSSHSSHSSHSSGLLPDCP